MNHTFDNRRLSGFGRTVARLIGGTALVTSAVLAVGPRIDAAPAPDAEQPAVNMGSLCHTPAASPLVRLAQTQSEVSPIGRKVVDPVAFVDREPPLWGNLGALTYPITTASAEAQKYFDQGLRLAYAFNHGEAQRAFRKAQKLDPSCAMCFWGEALVLGPNINMPMQDDAVAPAFVAVTKAKAMADKASPRERALIEALSARYAESPKADRAALDKAYAEAMGKVAVQFPDDNEILVLYAEAVMDLSPWDYWQPGGVEPKPQSAPVVPTLERVLAKDPNHPGAIHYYIHAVEASDRPERAEPYADRLGGAMPGAGHLVHMPSHIYYRVGRYLEALEANKTAVKVDEAYLAETRAPPGVYRLGYYPHNVHFVMASAQMSGDGDTVIAAAEKLQGLIPDDVARGVAFLQPIKAAPYFAHAQFSTPETILALPNPGEVVPYVTAMWRYTRGVAFAAQRNADAARAEAEAIAEIARAADFSVLTTGGVPAQDVLTLAQHVVHARIAQAQGDHAAAIERFEKAAALQDGLPYTEPPYWYYPVRQSLGAALVQAGRHDAAEEQLRLSLKRAPNNGWSFYGLSELAKARGDAMGANLAEQQLSRAWAGDRARLKLSSL